VKVLFVASEVSPFAKTGGLGDVSAALPRALRGRGHDVRVVMPMFPRVLEKGRTFELVIAKATLKLGPNEVHFSVHSCPLPGTDVPVYFVKCGALFDRANVYTQDPDEHLRFAVLSHAALVIAQRLGFAPDIVHANDWQTALLPLLLKTVYSWDRLFEKTRSILTIHNIGHQGTFDASVIPQIGLGADAHRLHQEQLQEGRINFLLTGILYANAITTVSPTYAREIQRPEHGVGLDRFLRERSDVLFGILNGIEEGEWSPATDVHLPVRYSADSLEGKEACKRELLRAARLPYAEHVPLIGIVSRLVWQKGFDLCSAVLPRLFANKAVQLLVLGTGEPKYEALFSDLGRAFPKQVVHRAGFSEPLAHLVEAGSDFFLMPSRYEPCGLNQMYSLAYGTPPIVHKTGGLADTVSHYDPRRNRGNGFVFEHFDEGGLTFGLASALSAWGTGRGADRAAMQELRRRGMAQRFGWDERVADYETVYRKVAPHVARA
jgi:starch synthase